MTHTTYDNGMNMNCHRYQYEHIQHLVLKNEIIDYDMLEIESDNSKNPFGIYFTYYFYYLKGKLVKSKIG